MRVRVDEDVAEAGLKPAVTPDGRPVAVRPTDPAKLPLGVIETEYVVPPPAVTVRDAGVTPSEKSPVGEAAWTTRVAGAEWLRLPLVPVIVNG